MDLEIVVTSNCPHREPAAVLQRAPLAEIGMVGAPFVTTVDVDADGGAAAWLHFLGAPHRSAAERRLRLTVPPPPSCARTGRPGGVE